MIQLMLEVKHPTWPLTLFLVNLSTCVLWYGLAYDPEETSLPRWAVALG